MADMLECESRAIASLVSKAHDVRRAFERGEFDAAIARQAYLAYAPDIDVDLFLRRSQKLFPALNCGLCSTYLNAVLGRGTVRRGHYRAERHTVLMVEAWVVDITADQFGGPPVYVGPLRRPWQLDDVA